MDSIFCDKCGRGLYGSVEDGKITVMPCGVCAREANTCRYCVEHGRTCCPCNGCTCAAPSSCPWCGSPRLTDDEMTYQDGANDTGHVEYLCHTWWDKYSSPWVDKVCKYIRSIKFGLEHPGLHLLEPVISETAPYEHFQSHMYGNVDVKHGEGCRCCTESQAEPEERRVCEPYKVVDHESRLNDFDMRDSKGKGLDEGPPL